MAKFPTWSVLVLSLLAVKGLSQDLDLFDALDDVPTKSPPPKPKPAPSGPGKDLDLSDFFDDLKPTTQSPRKPPVQPQPKPQPKPKPKPKPAADDFDLSDALDPKNDRPGEKGKGGGSDFSDSDLLDIADSGYKPDKGKGGRGGPDVPADNTDYDTDTMAEGGTIAGIASAVAMALVESLNSEYVKTENPETVIFQEPPAQQIRIEPPNAEPPSHDSIP
ncbi:hypothetical protein JZ751_007387 [Albula glossodonta]|uniref:CD99 antigen-like protein 2 n=1 Tax=Albula glossodonta TaxID=121402 RepID=A0A8T2MPV7_9TELE|nr:hypothetical protein JZ751_007387 [Albula glossodonta]